MIAKKCNGFHVFSFAVSLVINFAKLQVLLPVLQSSQAEYLHLWLFAHESRHSLLKSLRLLLLLFLQLHLYE